MKQSGAPSMAARSRIRRVISISLMASGTPSSESIISAAGISSNNSSMLSAPMASSISRVSSSV
jgi:hypothetical protein